MNLRIKKSLTFLLGTALLTVMAVWLLPLSSFNDSPSEGQTESIEQQLQEGLKKLDRVEKKAARSEYFFKLMRDPSTNSIPENIRNRELHFAKTLPKLQQVQRRRKAKNPSFKAAEYLWQSAGPFDVGGRTRALAVDQRDPDILLAGGVSGGMWKSTNGGASWQLRTPDLANLSVTSVAQDPTNPDVWYYASGEVLGNSASASSSAPYYGHGIYKSEDNGDTWSVIPQTATPTGISGLSIFNTVSRIAVSPTTGTVFISSNGYGIYRSTDGETFSGPVLGTVGEPLFTDLAVASDGTVAATISEASFGDQASANPSNSHNPGVFISNDDGQSWVDITPETYPETHQRSVVTFAPSNDNVLYVLTLKGSGNNTHQGVSFHRIDMDWGNMTYTSDDRSGNLPDFREANEAGYMELQGGYNMEVSVKPDDENYVFVSGTNIFRSDNGFDSAPPGGYDGTDESQKNQYWIGGYSHNNDNPYDLYHGGEHHPDQHNIMFPQPNTNPNVVWSGHDGGLSYTTNVTANEVSWENRDNGYVTSQFYSAALPPTPGDNRLVGGMQDNGTAFFELNETQNTSTQDISTGDGGYSYITENYIFVSSQYGRVIRWHDEMNALSYVSPQLDDEDLLFIHPYVVDPNNENIMYYAQENFIWRNTEMEQIPTGNSSSGTNIGWEELSEINTAGHQITAMAISQTPANILYIAGSSSNQAPVIKRLENANTATEGTDDISLPATADVAGTYVKDIAINPVNANEVIVVLSNYNVVGLYHSLDGGESWTSIEGNLRGNEQDPGPSLRSAAMIPSESGTVYLLGTSIGLYATQLLEGENTTWGQEAANTVGNAIADYVAIRITDGNVAVGTHGRGILYGDFQGSTNVPIITANPARGRAGEQITLTATNFEFSPVATENEVRFGTVQAEVVSATPAEITVIVPRGVIPRNAENNTVTISASNNNEESAVTSFRILPPQDFSISQNFPNPFTTSTRIPFDLPESAEVSLIIYDITGQKVREPLRQVPFNAGTYNQEIEMTGLASGIYIYRVIAEHSNGETFIDSKKMTLIK